MIIWLPSGRPMIMEIVCIDFGLAFGLQAHDSRKDLTYK
jgi:hypothetical protein